VKYWILILSLVILTSCADQEESGMLDISVTDDELINSIDADLEQELVDYEFLVKDTIMSDSSIRISD